MTQNRSGCGRRLGCAPGVPGSLVGDVTADPGVQPCPPDRSRAHHPASCTAIAVWRGSSPSRSPLPARRGRRRHPAHRRHDRRAGLGERLAGQLRVVLVDGGPRRGRRLRVRRGSPAPRQRPADGPVLLRRRDGDQARARRRRAARPSGGRPAGDGRARRDDRAGGDLLRVQRRRRRTRRMGDPDGHRRRLRARRRRPARVTGPGIDQGAAADAGDRRRHRRDRRDRRVLHVGPRTDLPRLRRRDRRRRRRHPPPRRHLPADAS